MNRSAALLSFALIATLVLTAPLHGAPAPLEIKKETRKDAEGNQWTALVVPLDNTGIARWEFITPQDLVRLFDDTTNLQARLESTVIEFQNQTLDRTIHVKLNMIIDPDTVNRTQVYGKGTVPEAEETLQRAGAIDGPCESRDGRRICLRTLTIRPAQSVGIPASKLASQAADVIVFTISFFDQLDKPTHQVGYIKVTPDSNVGQAVKFPPTVKVVGSIAGSLDPFLGVPDATSGRIILDPGHPYNGDQRSRFLGSGRIDFFYPLDIRADGRLTLLFKDGDLGTKPSDDSNKLSAAQYQFNVFTKRGISLLFGKITFAEPSNRIAVRERGEGFRVSWRNLSVSHLVRRESSEFFASSDNDDSEVSIFQIVNSPLNGNPFIRRYSVLALYGEDEKPSEARTYFTAGGELFFLSTKADFGGSLAAYTSERHAKPTNTLAHLRDGEGIVGLLTLTQILDRDKDNAPLRSLTGLLGAGTGDDPKTAEVDEGYIGETADFAGDPLFLSRFAVADVRFSDGLTVGRGLANKRYTGLKYTDNTWSLLSYLADKVLHIKDDVASRSTTITVHDYRFREAVMGRPEAGRGVDIEFLLEAPKGVKIGLAGSYFWPGKALESLVTKDAWAVVGRVSIEP